LAVLTRFTLNGHIQEVDAQGGPAQAMLLDVLRNQMGLRATRLGCGQEQCGSCHVLLDGRSVPSCTLPLWAVEGHAVTTLEGACAVSERASKSASPQAQVLHILQAAFVAEQAAQCGFCTSGMLISAAGLIVHNPQPSDAQVRQALDPHLCRCGAHNRILRAVHRAAAVWAGTVTETGTEAGTKAGTKAGTGAVTSTNQAAHD
jgi:nicotinate dehydrogenase subunit A